MKELRWWGGEMDGGEERIRDMNILVKEGNFCRITNYLGTAFGTA